MTTDAAITTQRLGRKGRPSDADWQALWERHAEIVSDARMQPAIDRALRRIEQARTQFGPRTGVAWSGGKDSVVIHHLAGRLGIVAGVYVAPEPVLEYADFSAWLSIHQPPGIRTLLNGITLDWLRSNPQCLFPDRFSGERRAAGIQAWNAFKWRGQRQYVREERLDFLILGRRTIDGNVVGTGGIHRSRDGFIAVNPIFDWSHEETIAYLRRHDLPLAPVYRLPGGFRKGPRAWPMTTLEQVLAREPDLYDQHRDWIDAALTETGG